MIASQIRRRLENLTAKIRPKGTREFTLEELCRDYWRRDQRGFLALVSGDCPHVRVFLESFQSEDAGVLTAGPGWRGRRCRTGQSHSLDHRHPHGRRGDARWP